MPIDWFPLWLRLRVAAIATAGAAPIGIPAAYWLANREFKGKDIVDAAVTLPLVVPPTVVGYYPPVVLAGSTGCMKTSLASRWCSPGKRRCGGGAAFGGAAGEVDAGGAGERRSRV